MILFYSLCNIVLFSWIRDEHNKFVVSLQKTSLDVAFPETIDQPQMR